MKRCLFVDDSSLIRKVAKRILNGIGVLVAEAESGEAALLMCAAEMPDIIVIDGFLPGTDVPEFIRRVRAIPAPVKPHILLCLVEMDVPAIMRAKRAGAQGYLLKPFDRRHLEEHIGSLLLAA